MAEKFRYDKKRKEEETSISEKLEKKHSYRMKPCKKIKRNKNVGKVRS